MTHLPRLRREDTILLVCDLQEKLLSVMLEGERMARHISLLAATARRLEIPVIVTEQNPEKLGPTVAPVREALGEHVPVAKMKFSAYVDEVRSQMEALPHKTVLLCGIESHICVMQTALDLIENGHTVFIPYDAISARQAWNRQTGWERMRLAGAIPSSTESAVMELLGEAGTEDFRALLPLIK